MAGLCATPADLGLVRGLLHSVDCNVGLLTSAGYAGLAGPNSLFSTLLTGLLTVYIAVMGLRLMLGQAPLRIGDLTLSMVKIGVILALATNWPLYQRLVSDLLLKGPEELAASMLGAGQIGAAPYDGLQHVYDELQASAGYFSQRAQGAVTPFLGGNAFGAFALNASSLILLLATLGMILAAKLVLGLLLAIGPVFITCMLFDGVRGLFIGWLRAAIAAAIAPMIALLGLVFALFLIEPHLVRLSAMRGATELDLSPTVAILLLSLITALVNLAGLGAGLLIATGLRWPGARPAPERAKTGPHAAPAGAGSGPWPTGQRVAPMPGLDRQSQIAAAAAAMERRDRLRLAPESAPATRLAGSGRAGFEPALHGPYAQESGRRSVGPRMTVSRTRRDG